jgi:uncharacterized protein YaaQ
MTEPGAEDHPAEPGQLKLVIVIAADSDADRLIKQLIGRGYPATKISSTGGFLRRGSATVLSGVEADEIDDILAIVRAECHARTEFLPVQTLPFFGEGAVVAEPVEVRMGGAIVFVLNVERFERT